MLRTAPAEFGDDTETGVVYTQEQWEAIRAIQETLESDTTEHDTTEHDTIDHTIDDTMDDTTDHDDTILQSQLMRLCQLIIIQDTSALTLYESPLMHYLAIRGIDIQAKGYRGPMHYTNILAGVLWII